MGIVEGVLLYIVALGQTMQLLLQTDVTSIPILSNLYFIDNLTLVNHRIKKSISTLQHQHYNIKVSFQNIEGKNTDDLKSLYYV